MDAGNDDYEDSLQQAAMDAEDFSYDDIEHRAAPLDTTDDQSNMSGLDLYTDMVIRDSEEAALSMAKLEEEKLSFKTQLEQALAEVDKLSKLNETLTKENQILRNNISVLMKTAKVELQRKERELKELRELQTPGGKTDLDEPTRRPRGRRLPRHKRGSGQQLQRQNGFPHTSPHEDATGQEKLRAREESTAAMNKSRNRRNASVPRSSAETLFVKRQRSKENRPIRQTESISPGDSSNITPIRIGVEVSKGIAKQDDTFVRDVGSEKQPTGEKSVKTDVCQAEGMSVKKSDSVVEAGVESQTLNDNSAPKELKSVSQSNDLRHKLDKKKDFPSRQDQLEHRSTKSKFEEKSQNIHPREPFLRNESPENVSKHLPQDKPSHCHYKSSKSSPDRKSHSKSPGRKSRSKEREPSPTRKSKERSSGDRLKRSRNVSPEDPSRRLSPNNSSQSCHRSSRSGLGDRKSGSRSPGRKTHTKLRDGSPARQNSRERSSNDSHRESSSALLSIRRPRGREETVNRRAEGRGHRELYDESKSKSSRSGLPAHKGNETKASRNKPSGSASKMPQHEKDDKRSREKRRSSIPVRDRDKGGSFPRESKPKKTRKSRNTSQRISERKREFSRERLSSIAKEAITKARATLRRCHRSSSASEHRERAIKEYTAGHEMSEEGEAGQKSSESSLPEGRRVDQSKAKEKSGDRWKRKRVESSSDDSDKSWLKKHKESIGDDFVVCEEPSGEQENRVSVSDELFTYEEGHTVLACGTKSTIECTSSKVTVLQNSVSESIDSTLSDISALSMLQVQSESPLFAPSLNTSVECARGSYSEKEENELSEGEIISSGEDEAYHGKECGARSAHPREPKQQYSLKLEDTKNRRKTLKKASAPDAVYFDHSSSAKCNDQKPKISMTLEKHHREPKQQNSLKLEGTSNVSKDEKGTSVPVAVNFGHSSKCIDQKHQTDMTVEKHSNATLDSQEETSQRIQSNSGERDKNGNIATKENEGGSSRQGSFQSKNTEDADRMPHDAVTCESSEAHSEGVEGDNPLVDMKLKEADDAHGMEGDKNRDEGSNSQRPNINQESNLSNVNTGAETSIVRGILYEDLRIDSDSTVTDTSVCTVESVDCSENTLTSAGTVKGENSECPINEIHAAMEIADDAPMEEIGTFQDCSGLRERDISCLVAAVSFDTPADPALMDGHSVSVPCIGQPAEPQFRIPQETRLTACNDSQSSVESPSPDSDDRVSSCDEIDKKDCVELTSLRRDHKTALDCKSDNQKGLRDNDDVMSVIAGDFDFSHTDSRQMMEEPDVDEADEEIIVKQHEASDLSVISCQTSTLHWTNPDIYDSSTQVDSQEQPKEISVTRLDDSIGTDACIPSVCGQTMVSGATDDCRQHSSLESEILKPGESHEVEQSQQEHVVSLDEDVIVQIENSEIENESAVKGHHCVPGAIKSDHLNPVLIGERAPADYKNKFFRHTESSSSQEERELTDVTADEESTLLEEEKPDHVVECSVDEGGIKSVVLSDTSSVQERDPILGKECASVEGDQSLTGEIVDTGMLSESCIQQDVEGVQDEEERSESGKSKANPIHSRENYLTGSCTDTSESELDFEEDIYEEEEHIHSDHQVMTSDEEGDVHESAEIDQGGFDDAAGCENGEGSYADKDEKQSADCGSGVNAGEHPSNRDNGGDNLPEKDGVNAEVSAETRGKEASPVNGDEASISTRDAMDDIDKRSCLSEGEISEGEIVSDDDSHEDRPEAQIMAVDDLRHKLGRARNSKQGSSDARRAERPHCAEDKHKSERGMHRLHGTDRNRHGKKRKRSAITRDPIYSRKENSKADDERMLERKKRLLEMELRQIEIKREMIQMDKETKRPGRRQQVSEEECRRLDRRKMEEEKREDRRRENFRRQQEVRRRNEGKQRDEHRKMTARLEEKERRHESYRKARRVTEGRKS
ncbi:uncharacterized protein [Diadema antillarum]|uniref:uncharacterized protein n=1 Tax=Diadema antillarum TaxID=105358 RepID=UPI003A8B6896